MLASFPYLHSLNAHTHYRTYIRIAYVMLQCFIWVQTENGNFFVRKLPPKNRANLSHDRSSGHEDSTLSSRIQKSHHFPAQKRNNTHLIQLLYAHNFHTTRARNIKVRKHDDSEMVLRSFWFLALSNANADAARLLTA